METETRLPHELHLPCPECARLYSSRGTYGSAQVRLVEPTSLRLAFEQRHHNHEHNEERCHDRNYNPDPTRKAHRLSKSPIGPAFFNPAPPQVCLPENQDEDDRRHDKDDRIVH